MGEAVMLALEDLAYLASHANSVEARRQLDLLMEATATYIEARLTEDEDLQD